MKLNFSNTLLEDSIGLYMKKKRKKFVPIWRNYGWIPHTKKKGQFNIMFVFLIFLIILLILWVFNPLLVTLVGSWADNTQADPTGKFFVLLLPIGLIFFFGIAGLLSMRGG